MQFLLLEEGLDVLPVQQNNCILYLPEHFFFPFSNRFLPYKRIFIGACVV